MSFNGKYELETHENFEPFMKAIGLPDDLIQKGKDIRSVSEIVQDGNSFKVTVTTGNKVLVNEFTVGQEAELETITGEKIKVSDHATGRNLHSASKCLITQELSLSAFTVLELLPSSQHISRLCKGIASYDIILFSLEPCGYRAYRIISLTEVRLLNSIASHNMARYNRLPAAALVLLSYLLLDHSIRDVIK
ncbi:UNVERIFIED_CONTAM: hypothetical protein FKN15_050713 [Acipenser sinensis]